MVGPFALEGYDVLAPLDKVGRRWRAVALADGRRVVLRLWIGAGARLADVRRLAALWSSAVADGVVPVLDVICQDDDLVVVTEAGEGLDALLARRPTVTPGQVVTLVVPLAETLASAHARGLVHGRVGPASIVLDDDGGRPRLTDYVFVGDGNPSADVAALVSLALDCLGDEVPAALGDALQSTVDARDLAERVRASVPAEPLMMPMTLVAIAPDAPVSHSANLRRAMALIAAVLAVAVAIGIWWGRHELTAGAALPTRAGPRGVPTVVPLTTPSPRATPAVPSWDATVRKLEHRRVLALAHADARSLSAVEAVGTALWHRDARVVAGLVAAHAHLRGLRMRVLAVDVETMSTQRVVVRVVDAMSSYDVVGDDGAILAHRPARRSRAVSLVIVRKNDNWFLDAVAVSAASPTTGT